MREYKNKLYNTGETQDTFSLFSQNYREKLHERITSDGMSPCICSQYPALRRIVCTSAVTFLTSRRRFVFCVCYHLRLDTRRPQTPAALTCDLPWRSFVATWRGDLSWRLVVTTWCGDLTWRLVVTTWCGNLTWWLGVASWRGDSSRRLAAAIWRND
jgi:hypothetical protein